MHGLAFSPSDLERLIYSFHHVYCSCFRGNRRQWLYKSIKRNNYLFIICFYSNYYMLMRHETAWPCSIKSHSSFVRSDRGRGYHSEKKFSSILLLIIWVTMNRSGFLQTFFTNCLKWRKQCDRSFRFWCCIYPLCSDKKIGYYTVMLNVVSSRFVYENGME